MRARVKMAMNFGESILMGCERWVMGMVVNYGGLVVVMQDVDEMIVVGRCGGGCSDFIGICGLLEG